MGRLLLRNADLIVTMDAARRDLRGGHVVIEDGWITSLGEGAPPPDIAADEVIDLAGHVVLPGLVNTHHHMFQSLTRAVPAGQDAELFAWLRTLYPIWTRLTPEMLRVSAMLAMAELILSGCTTSSDHLYLFPNGGRLDDTIEAASTIGLRFHAMRGSMSVGESEGGLPPDVLVEAPDTILRDTRRVIEAYHDAAPGALIRVGVAPCSPFSVSPDLMRESASLARAYGVGLHTHLAESATDIAYSRERFGQTPAEYAEALGWLGPDVWHAHCVRLDADGIARFGRTATGVAHCPCSNMRLSSGIAPVAALRAAGARVGIGVDGSASNDGGSLIGEARQALLLARVLGGPAALRVRDALEMATRGGAAVLGRPEIGALAPGMAADLVAWRLDAPGLAGAQHDPAAALVLCHPGAVAWSIIAGRVVVRDGRLAAVDLPALVTHHNRLAASLMQ